MEVAVAMAAEEEQEERARKRIKTRSTTVDETVAAHGPADKDLVDDDLDEAEAHDEEQ